MNYEQLTDKNGQVIGIKLSTGEQVRNNDILWLTDGLKIGYMCNSDNHLLEERMYFAEEKSLTRVDMEYLISCEKAELASINIHIYNPKMSSKLWTNIKIIRDINHVTLFINGDKHTIENDCADTYIKTIMDLFDTNELLQNEAFKSLRDIVYQFICAVSNDFVNCKYNYSEILKLIEIEIAKKEQERDKLTEEIYNMGVVAADIVFHQGHQKKLKR